MTDKPAVTHGTVTRPSGPVPPYQPPSAEQRELARQLRTQRRAEQEPERCKKHPAAPSRLFAVQEPGRRVRHVWLCVNCAAALVGLHHATLRRP